MNGKGVAHSNIAHTVLPQQVNLAVVQQNVATELGVMNGDCHNKINDFVMAALAEYTGTTTTHLVYETIPEGSQPPSKPGNFEGFVDMLFKTQGFYVTLSRRQFQQFAHHSAAKEAEILECCQGSLDLVESVAFKGLKNNIPDQVWHHYTQRRLKG